MSSKWTNLNLVCSCCFRLGFYSTANSIERDNQSTFSITNSFEFILSALKINKLIEILLKECILSRLYCSFCVCVFRVAIIYTLSVCMSETYKIDLRLMFNTCFYFYGMNTNRQNFGNVNESKMIK